MSVVVPQQRSLHKDDLADLRRSGLIDATIELMGCYSVTRDEIRELTGSKKVGSAGYAIPYPGLLDQTGKPYYRYRLRKPNDGMKYASGVGEDPQLYVPPGLAHLPYSDVLVVTEGEKKAAAAVQAGIHCVGIQGVSSWADAGCRAVEKGNHDNTTSDTSPITAILTTASRYRRVLVLGDSDTVTNAQSNRALTVLARSLRRRVIRAVFAACPPVVSDKAATAQKQGLDDWLIAEPSLARRSLEPLFYCHEVLQDGINDDYNAREFAELAADGLAYSRHQWFTFGGPHWEPDDSNKRVCMAARIGDRYRYLCEGLDELYRRIAGPLQSRPESQWPEEATKWAAPIKPAIKILHKAAIHIGNRSGIDGALALAQHRLKVADEVWDADPNLLAVKNGVVDLRTGELCDAQPSDYLSRCAGAEYSPEASAPRFMTFLERVQPDIEIRDYLQRLSGYVALGNANEQKFLTFYGDGRNGKTTFTGALKSALGTYAVKAPMSMVAEQSPERPRNDLARLAGARFVSMSETGENLRIDSALVKSISGGDVICARFLNREFFEFKPCFTAILDTNHVPRFRENGEAIRRRLVVVPWSITIPDAEENKNLPAELHEELSGILTWIVAGAKLYLERGLSLPLSLEHSRDAVLGLRDDVNRWLDACVECGGSFAAQSSVAYRHFQQWTNSTISQKAFSMRLKEIGFESGKRNGEIHWFGMQIGDVDAQRTSRMDSAPVGTVEQSGAQYGRGSMPGGSSVV